MAGVPFQIPGLGQARPNEQLPVENFAPDLIAAAASIVGENEVVAGGTNGDAQLERREQEKKQEEKVATKTSAATHEGHDCMAFDISDTSTLTAIPGEDQDMNMHDQESTSAQGQAPDVDMKTSNDAPSPDVTDALEAALNGMMPHVAEPAQPTQDQDGDSNMEQQQDAGNAPQEQAPPEWEADSSPYESSSESSSSDSDSDDDSEDGGGYPLLGIEETARLLMAADGDGDGDGDGTGKSKGTGAALRTKNEMPEEVMPKPAIVITPEMKIERLGNIEFVVENTIVIKSQTPGEVQVLDSGSVLCKEDRTVIGALAEVLGNVRSPMYTVGFPTEDEVKELELVAGMPIYYSVEHANYVFTQPLKQVKGTDASNLHDEELPADEMEFSDDEKEAEYKKQQKLKRRGGKAGRGGREQSMVTSHTHSPYPPPGAGLNYDDDEDGPYRPLARPAGYGQGGPPSLPSLPPKPETGFSPPRGGRGRGNRGAHRGARGDFRGRNHRGGHRGGDRGGDRRHGSRGGGSGSYPQFGRDGAASPQTGFPNIPAPPPQNPHLPPPPFGAKTPTPAGQWPAPPAPFAPPPMPYQHSQPAQPHVPLPHHQPPAGNFNFNYQAWNQNQGQQYQYPQAAPHHQSPPPPQPVHTPGYGQPFVPPQAPAWPAAGAAQQAPPVAGAYNPALFGGYQQAQQTPQGQQYWPQQQHGAYGQGPSQ
ncbi:Gar1/Naf1 RNA binding region-domain-containing protein [Chaetomidium leptoderma]|uniref:H/ACA ribonucleoprotein complex non-core subunit NAF1 n=1 Tax=Chaetomidium leptoderma TaxID=669021 RepID=A0AAN6ZWS4_9PEZI|nr:Gar1/Naf1 RNA binding region-domain-containing protein [Chaetomidium leptoderma]